MGLSLIRPVTITESVLVSSNVTETSAWSAATTYSAGQTCYELIGGVHQQFTSKAGGNLNHQPSLDLTGTYWTADGPTNRWKMFDGAYQTQTSRADAVTVQLDLPADELLNTLWLGNLSGSAVTLTVTDATDGVVFTETRSLVSVAEVEDEYDWCFVDPVRMVDTLFEDLPPYAGALVDVSITASGETVACGALVMGFATSLGSAQWNASIAIRDYSVKDENEFGDLVVVERAYRKIVTANALVRNASLDAVVNTLTEYRATAALFVINGTYGAMVFWGFVKDWNVEMSLPPDYSLLSFTGEGLT